MIARLLAAALCAVSVMASPAAAQSRLGESLNGYEDSPRTVGARAIYCQSTEETRFERSQYKLAWDEFGDVAAVWSVLYGDSLRHMNPYEYSSGVTGRFADPARSRAIRAACDEDLRRLQALGGTLSRTWSQNLEPGLQRDMAVVQGAMPLETEPGRAERDAAWCLAALGFVQRRLPASAAELGMQWSEDRAEWHRRVVRFIAPWQERLDRLAGAQARAAMIRMGYDGFYDRFADLLRGPELTSIRQQYVELEATICAEQMHRALRGGAQ